MPFRVVGVHYIISTALRVYWTIRVKPGTPAALPEIFAPCKTGKLLPVQIHCPPVPLDLDNVTLNHGLHIRRQIDELKSGPFTLQPAF